MLRHKTNKFDKIYVYTDEYTQVDTYMNDGGCEFDRRSAVTGYKLYYYYKTHLGYEYLAEYDDNGNIVHCKSSSDNEEHWYSYNEKNKIVNHEINNGFKETIIYDENGKIIFRAIKDEYGNEHEYNYHMNGEVKTHLVKRSSGGYLFEEYNDKGYIIYCDNKLNDYLI